MLTTTVITIIKHNNFVLLDSASFRLNYNHVVVGMLPSSGCHCSPAVLCWRPGGG